MTKNMASVLYVTPTLKNINSYKVIHTFERLNLSYNFFEFEIRFFLGRFQRFNILKAFRRQSTYMYFFASVKSSLKAKVMIKPTTFKK